MPRTRRVARSSKQSHPHTPRAPRTLADLVSIGPAMLDDFALLKIRSVEQLAKQDPQRLYDRLCRLTGTRQDPCVLDTFHAAVAQAKDPKLPAEKCQWWYWSRVRKAGAERPPR